eukprot:scaffold11564_cov116-Isochrysis_galbana.AAC.9
MSLRLGEPHPTSPKMVQLFRQIIPFAQRALQFGRRALQTLLNQIPQRTVTPVPQRHLSSDSIPSISSELDLANVTHRNRRAIAPRVEAPPPRVTWGSNETDSPCSHDTSDTSDTTLTPARAAASSRATRPARNISARRASPSIAGIAGIVGIGKFIETSGPDGIDGEGKPARTAKSQNPLGEKGPPDGKITESGHLYTYSTAWVLGY